MQSSGKSIAQVARELGISDSSIHQWRKELAEHRAALVGANITVSMSRTGNCYDNAVTESFFWHTEGRMCGTHLLPDTQ